MLMPSAVSLGLGFALVVAAVQDVGEGIVLGGAILAALAYAIKLLRAAVRKGDEILTELPASHAALTKQVQEQHENHEAAHAEMLSMVNHVSAQVEALDERLARVEARGADEHEHVQAITREFDVPVRRKPRDAA